MKKRVCSMLLALTMLISLIPTANALRSTEVIAEAILEFLYYHEGSYGSINRDDNGAVSVGKIQWHATRALNLLKSVIEADSIAAEEILGSELYTEIVTSTDWSTRTVTAEEASALSELLTTDQGKAAQDALALEDVSSYINRGKRLGIVCDEALIYFADLENQGGAGMSTRVARAAAENVGSFEAVTLLDLHNAALEDRVAGRYPVRRNNAYTYSLNYVWTESYTVSLDACGGTVTPDSITVAKYGTYGTLPVPVREGYTFLYWSSDAGSTQIRIVDASTVIVQNEDHTLYAHWVSSGEIHSHSYSRNTIMPTCTGQGASKYVCPCGHYYWDDYTDPLGHTYSDAADITCDRCGEVQEIPSVPMYRMYNPNSGEHFYTGSVEERDILLGVGWNYEGVAFNFPTKGEPVYRIYNPRTGDHLYTMDLEERNALLAQGWNDENVAFNSAPKDGVPQYRLWNPNAEVGAWHFTGSEEERDDLLRLGWQYQGIGWYSSLY